MAELASRTSLLDEITDRLFTELEDAEEFDAETIERLRQWASSGALKKHRQVTKAIRVGLEVQNETC